MSAKRKGRGKVQKGKLTPSEALGSYTTSISVQNVIGEEDEDTPQDPGHLGSL